MLWASDDNGYLFAVDLPERGVCRHCGAVYLRSVENAKWWQREAPDVCPACGREGVRIAGVRFLNRLVSPS